MTRVAPGEHDTMAPSIRVFGGMGLAVDGEPISIGGPRQQQLLALLALRAGSVVEIDWLAEHLWSDDERPAATAPALRTYVSRLRGALPNEAQEWIETVPSGYRLRAPDDAVEHLRFMNLRAAAKAARDHDDPAQARELLDEALGLWRGRPFRELDDVDAARAQIEQLELDRLEMLEERWETALALGQHTQITGELAAFTNEHGLRDRAARQYALALHRSGRTPEALRVLENHRRTVADTTGLDPSPAVVELEQSLLTGDPSLEAAPEGRPLRGYRLIEEAGVGAFAVVWRAIQPSVGREVAIKQIRAELASQPDFIRRFEAEAHLVARIEHPHIVPLIDFWRDPDSAYLVMRWLPGGTLERRLDDGPLSVAETLSLAHQIGGALSAAHAHGVIHRDVKTGNILFDDAGHTFLGDFGIALEAAESAGPEAALSPGSPAYSAPEQIRREQLGPQADVFSLGVVLFECLTGSLPFAAMSARDLVERQLNEPYPSLAELRSDVPTAVSEAVLRATAKDPADRIESIAEFLDALEPAAAEPSGSGAPIVGAVANPYVGLQAFDDGDAGRFFGRERLVSELLDRLAGDTIRSRSVVVVGPSGSGKSSVVRAGLVPALRVGRIDGSDDWYSTTMMPGTDPFEALEAALLRVAVNPPPTLLDQLRDGSRGILRSVRRCLPNDRDRVVLVIDQLEEVFTGATAADADHFLDALAEAVAEPTSPLRLVATLRADYYDRPLAHPTFARVLKETAVDVTPLAPDELERAIVEPARRQGVAFEPGLVARIAAEASGQPSPLPLLQYALSELFDRRDGAMLTIAAYDEVGGLSGALASRAEAIYASADADQRVALRRVFGALADPAASSADLRRRVPVADLGGEVATAWVLDQLGAARLVTFDRDVATREPTVEVAHEALLREWPRLVDWLHEDAALLRSVDELHRAATTWDGGGQDESDLARGGRLESALGLVATAGDRLRPVDRDFVEASRVAAEAERQDEAGRVRRLRRLVVAVACALVVALVAGGVALVAQRRADDEAAAATAAAADAESEAEAARAATARADLATLVSRSASVAAEDPRLGLLLALEANGRSSGPETEQAVLNALGSSALPNVLSSLGLPPWGDDSTCAGVAIAQNDGRFDTAIRNGEFVIRDRLTGEIDNVGPPPTDGCPIWMGSRELDRKLAFSRDQGMIWTATYDGPWSEGIPQPDVSFIIELGHNASGTILMGVDRPDGSVQMRVLDDLTGEALATIEIESGVFPLDPGLSGSGDLVVLPVALAESDGGVGRTLLYDASTGRLAQELATPLPVDSFDVDENAGQIVTIEQGGSMTTFDIETGETVARLDAVIDAQPLAMRIQPDGLITIVLPGEVGVFDRRTGRVGDPVELRGVAGARIRDDGRITIITDDRGVSQVIDLSGNALVERSWAVSGAANLGYAGGVVAAVTPPGGTPQRIDLTTGERTNEPITRADGTAFEAAVVIPEADGMWAIGAGNEIVRFADGEIVERLPRRSEIDGGRVVFGFVATFDTLADGASQIRMNALDRGNLRTTFTVDTLTENYVAEPTTDGGLVVLTDDGTLRSYDPAGELVHEVATGIGDGLSINPDPSSSIIAVPTEGGGAEPAGVVLIDLETDGQERLPIDGNFTNATFADDGRLLALIDANGSVRIWDVERDASAGLVWNGTGSVGGKLSWIDEQTGELWVQTSGRLIAVPLDPQHWIERACEVAGRPMTQAEWDRLVPGGGSVVDRCQ
ncbi:MAG: protein kinase [Ilumatobacteraceae bacterium]|nr:protein kinase [Ilumatobacteraceae bacterium]